MTALAVPGAPIVQNQIRPFVIAARPVVRNLRPASINLAAATPNLSHVFAVLNHFVNMLGYNPGNTEHGYLWWLAWLDHNARTLFSIQDANGDFRPLFLQASCASLAQIASNVPNAETIFNLTPILTTAGLCPAQAAADVADYKRYQQQQQSGALNGHAAPSRPGTATTPGSGSAGSGATSTTPGSSGTSTTGFYPQLPTG
ncbi:MAG: hypothetical protein JO206_12375 [Solirubrobacterales bacterium]|nr:hypothetical protein [Solirubrobacterales bacterium]